MFLVTHQMWSKSIDQSSSLYFPHLSTHLFIHSSICLSIGSILQSPCSSSHPFHNYLHQIKYYSIRYTQRMFCLNDWRDKLDTQYYQTSCIICTYLQQLNGSRFNSTLSRSHCLLSTIYCGPFSTMWQDASSTIMSIKIL